MKIALIGDVHANLPALEAVLAHAGGEGAAAIWNIGDFVGYNAFPEEVVRLLDERGAVSVVGNYDLKVLRFPRRRELWKEKKQPLKYRSFEWTYEQLSVAGRDHLASLPRDRRLQLAGRSVLMTHGSPASIDEHLYPETPVARFAQLGELAGADLVICGHSHRAFVRGVGDTLFVNTGSVGRPDDGDPRACYATLEVAGGEPIVRHFRVAYDVERAVGAIRAAGLPEAFAQMIIRGRALATVLAE